MLLAVNGSSFDFHLVHGQIIIYGKCELEFQKFSFSLFMVGKFCGQFGTEAVYFRFMLKDF